MDWRESSTFLELNLVIFHVVVSIWSRSSNIGILSKLISSTTRYSRWSKLQHLVINHHIKSTGTQRCHASQHNVLGDTSTVIQLGRGSSIKQDLNCLFKRTTHQGTRVSSVDTMTSDGHQMATRSHHIHQKSHMTVVNVRTIKRNDIENFLVQSRTSGLNSQHRKNFNEVVGVCSGGINTGNCHNVSQIASIGFQNPFAALSVFTRLIWEIDLVAHHENSDNTRNTSQRNRVQHMSFNSLQDLIFFSVCVFI